MLPRLRKCSHLVTLLGHVGLVEGGVGTAERESKEQGRIGKGQMQRKQGAPGKVVLTYQFQTAL